MRRAAAPFTSDFIGGPRDREREREREREGGREGDAFANAARP